VTSRGVVEVMEGRQPTPQAKGAENRESLKIEPEDGGRDLREKEGKRKKPCSYPSGPEKKSGGRIAQDRGISILFSSKDLDPR